MHAYCIYTHLQGLNPKALAGTNAETLAGPNAEALAAVPLIELHAGRHMGHVGYQGTPTNPFYADDAQNR